MLYRGFLITYDPPPIPMRGFDYEFSHVDFDGPDDHRCGVAGSIYEAKALH
jgi:hypothetical protein